MPRTGARRIYRRFARSLRPARQLTRGSGRMQDIAPPIQHIYPTDLRYGTIGKGKVFPYSLPSVGPGADPGVQAVSPQVT